MKIGTECWMCVDFLTGFERKGDVKSHNSKEKMSKFLDEIPKFEGENRELCI